MKLTALVLAAATLVSTSASADIAYRILNKSAANIEVVHCLHNEQHATLTAGQTVYVNASDLCYGALSIQNAFGTEILYDDPRYADRSDTILIEVEGSLFGQWVNKWWNNEPVKPTEVENETGGDGSYSATYNTLAKWFF